jgi:hypothetical protein
MTEAGGSHLALNPFGTFPYHAVLVPEFQTFMCSIFLFCVFLLASSHNSIHIAYRLAAIEGISAGWCLGISAIDGVVGLVGNPPPAVPGSCRMTVWRKATLWMLLFYEIKEPCRYRVTLRSFLYV